MPEDLVTGKPYQRKFMPEEVYLYQLKVSKGKGKQWAQDQKENLLNEVQVTPSPTAALSALSELSIYNGLGEKAIFYGNVAEQALIEIDSPKTLAYKSHVPTSSIALVSASLDLAPTPATTSTVLASSLSSAPSLIAPTPDHAPTASALAPAPTLTIITAASTLALVLTYAAGSIGFLQQQIEIDTRFNKLEQTINRLNTRLGELETLVGKQAT